MFVPLQPDQVSSAPGVGSRQPTLSDTVNEPRPFRSLAVFAAGDVSFVGGDNEVSTWSIPASALPFIIPVWMLRVRATGTTVAAASLRGIV